jgi:acyl carrier protein
MPDDDVLRRITTILALLIEQSDLVVAGTTVLNDLPDWDSIKYIEAIALTEEEFLISVSMSDIHSINTVGDLVRVVRTGLTAQP